MGDLISRLAEIRELQGREPLPDPSKIQGFDPQALPPEPEFPVRPPVDLSQVPDAPDLDDEMLEDESPLIPRAGISGNFPPPIEPVRLDLPKPDLAVAGYGERCVAQLTGREVELSSAEQASIKAVILRALQRQVREQIAALQALLPPKRKRKARVRPTGTATEQIAPPVLPRKPDAYDLKGEPIFLKPEPKKRGRKPRQRLDGSVS